MMIETDWIKQVIRDYWKTILSANIKPSDPCHLNMSAKSFFINIGLWLFPQIKLNKFCPSIPIKFANFGMELTPNSNSSLGIGATTPTPIQRNWGDSKGFHMFEFPSLHPGVTSSPKKTLVTPGSHLFSTFSTDFKTNIGIPWNPPNFVELEL